MADDVRDGLLALRDGDVKAAHVRFKRALAADAFDVEALLGQGIVAVTVGRPDVAERYMRRAVSVAPGVARAYDRLADLLGRRRDVQGQEAALHRACRLEPTASRLRAVGRRQAAAGRRVAAEAAFRRAVAVAPDRADVHHDLALALEAIGDPRNVTVIGRAAALNPSSTGAWYDLARTLTNGGDVDGALRAVERAVTLQLRTSAGPDVNTLELACALSTFGPDDGAAAYHDLMRARSYGSDVHTRCAARRALRQGRLEDAERWFRRHPGGLYGGVRLSPLFFDLLAREAPDVAGVPLDVVDEAGSGSPCAIVLAACDATYLRRYGGHLAASFAATQRAGSRLHMHLLDTPPAMAAAFAALLRRLGLRHFAVSVEAVAQPTHVAPAIRYACARYRLAPHLVRRYGCPLFIIDVDTVMGEDVAAYAARTPARHLAVVARYQFLDPRQVYQAGTLIVQPTPETEAFLNLAARYMNWFLECPREPLTWFFDQSALYCCLTHLQHTGAPAGFVHAVQRDALPYRILNGRIDWDVLRQGEPYRSFDPGPWWPVPGAAQQ